MLRYCGELRFVVSNDESEHLLQIYVDISCFCEAPLYELLDLHTWLGTIVSASFPSQLSSDMSTSRASHDLGFPPCTVDIRRKGKVPAICMRLCVFIEMHCCPRPRIIKRVGRISVQCSTYHPLVNTVSANAHCPTRPTTGAIHASMPQDVYSIESLTQLYFELPQLFSRKSHL